MAVQAQRPSNAAVPDLRNRNVVAVAQEYRGVLGFEFGSDNQMSIQVCQAETQAQLQVLPHMFNAVPNIMQGPSHFHFHDEDLSRKRLGNSTDVASLQHQRPMLGNLTDLRQQPRSNPVVGMLPHPTTAVSTGLRLAFEDEQANATKSSVATCDALSVFPSLADALSSQLQKQQEEIDQLLRLQVDVLRQNLEEKTHRHSHSLISLLGDGFLRCMREKDLEIEKASLRVRELEEQVKQLKLEACLWQGRAKDHEAMIITLKKGLQQAVGQVRDQSKEGCGDSEAADAESMYLDPNCEMQHLHLSRATWNSYDKRLCKLCNKNNICILILPCRHLCLCKDCNAQVESCPICFLVKNASVEVFMA